ncbi:MAG: ammonia channel protein, partial [candidate division NC10 bacterium]
MRTRQMVKASILLIVVGALLIAPAMVFAQQAPPPAAPSEAPTAAPAAPAPPKIDSGDTAWMLTSSALVLLMTAPGLALFYGGLVRRKNALGTIMHSFIILALITIQWALWGYSLAFGPDRGGIIGSLAWVGLRGVGLDPNPDYG